MAASTVMDASYDRKRYVRQPACVSYQTFVEAELSQRAARAGSSRDDVVEAETIFEELASTTRRVYGEFHPFAKLIQHELVDAQEKLAAFDASHRV